MKFYLSIGTRLIGNPFRYVEVSDTKVRLVEYGRTTFEIPLELCIPLAGSQTLLDRVTGYGSVTLNSDGRPYEASELVNASAFAAEIRNRQNYLKEKAQKASRDEQAAKELIASRTVDDNVVFSHTVLCIPAPPEFFNRLLWVLNASPSFSSAQRSYGEWVSQNDVLESMKLFTVPNFVPLWLWPFVLTGQFFECTLELCSPISGVVLSTRPGLTSGDLGCEILVESGQAIPNDSATTYGALADFCEAHPKVFGENTRIEEVLDESASLRKLPLKTREITDHEIDLLESRIPGIRGRMSTHR